MRAPDFWQHDGLLAALLGPFSALTALATARRVARPGWRAPVPVICCGNATAGGAGKTTLALELAARLAPRRLAFLTRGHKGRERGPYRVTAGDTAGRVGDEALLLAEVAPTWVAADRAAGARAAVAEGAELLVMDDGLQNPTLVKDLSLLVIDGASGFGNGRVIPAGPLREPVAAAAARCGAAVLIGEDRTGALARLPPALAVVRASLVQKGVEDLVGRRVFAFAGIGLPEKFFVGLQAAGVAVVGTRAFPDHHPFTAAEIDDVLGQARAANAWPVTTPKDAARLTATQRAALRVVGVGLSWQDEAAIDALLEPLR
ncbi:MAG: tetraacyldisaccharide 4'-kinase [Nevskia sp.]|nr:tetraacyldisaccharide 4'-kinase [Nevskia sp.]